MKVEPLEFLTYKVHGQEAIYRVDLSANNFFGHCACKHHRYRVQKALNRGETMEPCKHIKDAKLEAWNSVAPLLAKHWAKGKN